MADGTDVGLTYFEERCLHEAGALGRRSPYPCNKVAPTSKPSSNWKKVDSSWARLPGNTLMARSPNSTCNGAGQEADTGGGSKRPMDSISLPI